MQVWKNSFSHLELTNSYSLFRSQSFVLDYKPFLISLYTLNWQLMSVLFVSSHAPCSADFSLWVFNSVNFGSIPSSSIFCLFLLQFRAYSFLFNLGPFLSWSNKFLFLPYITWKCPYRHIRISPIFSPDKLQFNTWVGNEILNKMAVHEKPYTGNNNIKQLTLGKSAMPTIVVNRGLCCTITWKALNQQW